MSEKIFISYSYSDGVDIARQLVAELEAASSPCWMGQRDMRAGADFPTQIVRAIRDCRALVVLLTPGANGSRDVLQEVHLAHNARKPMVPIVVGGTLPSDGLAYYVGIVQQVTWNDARAAAATVRAVLTGAQGSAAQEDPARRDAQQRLAAKRREAEFRRAEKQAVAAEKTAQLESRRAQVTNKVAAITFRFWLLNFIASTLGVYADFIIFAFKINPTTGFFCCLIALVVLLTLQVSAKGFHPFLYWATIVASAIDWATIVASAIAGFQLETSYDESVLLLLASVLGLVGLLTLWRFCCGSVSVRMVTGPKAEAFYWATILLSHMLGTSLCRAWYSGLGHGLVVVLALALLAVAAVHLYTPVSKVALFWIAFVLTASLAVALVGSIVIAVAMIVCLLFLEGAANGFRGARNAD